MPGCILPVIRVAALGLFLGPGLAPDLFAGEIKSGPDFRAIPTGEEQLELFDCLALWSDPTGRAEPASVLRREFEEPCHPAPQIGFRNEDLWIKINLANESPGELVRWLEYDNALARRLDLYVFDGEGELLEFHADGYGVPANARRGGKHWPIFRLRFPAGSERILLLRVRSDYFIRAYIRLLSPATMRAKESRRRIAYAAFYGITIFMAFGTTIGFVFMKSPMSGLLALGTILSISFLATLDGFLLSYGQAIPIAAAKQMQIGTAFSPLAGACAHIFFGMILEIRRETNRRLFYVFHAPIALYLIGAVFYFIRPVWGILTFQVASVPAAIMTVSLLIYFWRQGMVHVRFLLFGLVPVLIVAPSVLGELFAIEPPPGFELTNYRFIFLYSILCFVLTLLDRMVISERNFAENLTRQVSEKTAQLEAARSSAEEANAFKENIVRMVAHDLRSPLAAVKANLPLLDPAASSKPEERTLILREISRTIDGVIKFSNSILSDRHLHAEDWTPRRDWYALGGIAEEAIVQARGLFTSRNVRLENRIGPVEWWLDPEYMLRILVNLLSNAAKFTGPGDLVSLESPAPDTLVVHDTGIGMSSEILASLRAGELATRNGLRGEKGRGLGLRQCQKLIALHGGALDIDSRENEGSRFTIRWPRRHFRAN